MFDYGIVWVDDRGDLGGMNVVKILWKLMVEKRRLIPRGTSNLILSLSISQRVLEQASMVENRLITEGDRCIQ